MHEPHRVVVVLNQEVGGVYAGVTAYGAIIDGELPACIRNVQFSWARALLGRYDIVHVQWPDHLVRGSGVVGMLRASLAALFLLRLRLGHKQLIRTAHNLAPHERLGAVEAALCRVLDARTSIVIRLSEEGQLPIPAPHVTIPHPHYQKAYSGYPRAEAVPGTLMFAGLIRPYKGVDALLDAFSQLADDHATLRFVGSAEDPSLAGLLQSSADRDPRISLLLEMVPDARLVHEMTSAQVVVLPYRRLYNSGLLLAALSLARPVVVPRTATTEAISAEVGAGWVRSYDGVLTADHLCEALLAPAPASPPQLAGREPLLVGLAHHDLYVEAARAGRGL